MHSARSVILLLAILVHAASLALAQSTPSAPRVGEIHEIRITRISSQQSKGGSSGNSQSNQTLVERVIGIRYNGLEFEYDLPEDPRGRKSVDWQYPVRILKPNTGPLQLLNSSELEARVDAWLKAANLNRDACGRWIFTWTAFQIECDPNSVTKTLDAFDLRIPDLREGTVYRIPEGRGTATLRTRESGSDGATFAAELEIDPDYVRKKSAEADVVVGGITQRPVTLDDALRRRSTDIVSGTIAITLDADSRGNVWRRTKVTKTDIERTGVGSETTTVTETVERRLAAGRAEKR